MKKGEKMKSIGTKFLLPMLGVILVTTIGLGIFSYQSQKNTLTNIMEQTTELAVEDTIELISDREASVETLKQALNNYLITITKGVAESLKGVSEEKLNEEAIRLTKYLGISEIHIVDGNGILQWGSVPDFYGFDFSTTEQTKPFLPGLTDKNFAMAQEAQERGTDKELFQYITVARTDQPGLIQIGITPKELQALLDKVNVRKIAQEKKVGEDGFIFVFDRSGTVISHPEDSELGKTLEDYEWGNKLKETEHGNFINNSNGIEAAFSFTTTDRYIIAALVPTYEYYGQLESVETTIIGIILLTIILASGTMYLLTNHLIIKRIKKMLAGVTEIGNGNLNAVIAEGGQDEIGHLAAGLNHMAANLKSLVMQIIHSASDLNNAADAAAEASGQVSTASNEIAMSVNEIASGTSDQAQEIQISVEQLETVSHNVETIMENTNIINEKVNEIEEKNTYSLKTVNQLKEKFIENKEATSKLDKKITLLAERSDKIEAITETITSISEQTNLLALNASIESARAGEAGKGFAVVADEIRKLAAQSAKAASEIEQLINEIKTDIAEAVNSIQVTEKAVEESDDKLIDTMNTFHSLKESNDALVVLAEQFEEICENLNKNTGKVIDSINTIASVSEETAATSEEISAASEEQNASVHEISNSIAGIKELTKGLVDMINKFKLD